MESLDAFINRVQDLPPAPRTLPELLVLLNEPDIDSSRVVELLTYDPALTASVLRLCNSAYLGASRPAEDLHEAITRLGFRRVYQLVAAISGARSLTPPQRGYGLNGGELWRHSVVAALAAELIAAEVSEDESLAFTAGLLHDLGKIVLSEALSDQYDRIIEETEQHRRSMHETEKQLLGVEHAEVGGRLLERWRLPASLVKATWLHHTPGGAGDYARLASVVYLGNMVAHCMGFGSGYQSFALHGRAEVFGILQIEPEKWPLFVVQTWERLGMAQSLLAFRG